MGGCLPGPVAAARDGSSSPGIDLKYQYSPLGAGAGEVKANWDAAAGANDYRVAIGSSPGATDVVAATSVGNVTSHTATGLTLQGAWTGATYYVTVTPVGTGGDGLSATSNGVQIAEAANWDGASTAGLRNVTAAGFSADFPPGSGWTVFFGSHYFESTTIASGTTVRVQPFGKADNIQSGGATANPKDGWLAIYANSITVDGTIDSHGRGYGGGPGVNCFTGHHGSGGSGGLSGAGGFQGGAGSGGGGGGAATCAVNGTRCLLGGAGGAAGGGGGGAGASTGAGRNAGADGSGGSNGNASVAGGSLPYQGGRGNPVGNDNSGGGGGAGYGAGGGAATDGCCGSSSTAQIAGGGGGGGTGGYVTGGASVGAGPSGGQRACCGTAGGCGQGGPPGAGGAATVDFALGAGGAGGEHKSQYEGGTAGGGGGAGGGAILLYAEGGTIRLGATSALRTSGAGGGGSAGNCGACFTGGGGGGGGGGTISLRADAVQITSGAVLDARGGSRGLNEGEPAHGGDGASQTSNGGVLKVFYKQLPGVDPNTYSTSTRQVVKTAI